MSSYLNVSGVWATSSIIYLLLGGCLAMCVWENAMVLRRSGPTYVLGILMVSIVMRGIWMVSKATGDDGELVFKLLSRFSILLQLSAVSVLVNRWYQSLTLPGAGHGTKAVPRVLIVTNVVLYVAILVTTRSGNDGSDGSDKDNTVDVVYRINSMLLGLVFVVISTATIIYGNRLATAVQNSTNAEVVRIALPKIKSVSWSLFWCFLIRAICYSYTPISGERATNYPVLDTIMYPLCFYHIAEIIPAAVIGWSMLSDRDERGIKKRYERGEICSSCWNKEPQERETGFGDALKMKMKNDQDA
eukprot:CAMPEP_0197554324 /NCGR_PEP_ID=MMETSP1320-20131121/11131_1 /TAXON_ID=91990 /ORGANISM="Bolidomonas sp., Strain RCC2347" /LENGTH=301 /DNA_ID=CAMNT_0043115191 /DNA_START=83 /DNA_END=985 /DNA_ORIENTATION=-